MLPWRIHHAAETVSTNLDARAGGPGDVFTADHQTAGRGRLDHKWLAPPGVNLALSAVLPVADAAGEIPPEEVATLPLVVGLAVVRAVDEILAPAEACPHALLKWPNDVLVGGRKVCGILCERHGDSVIAGIGVNVKSRPFPPEIAATAASLEDILDATGTRGRGTGADGLCVAAVRDAVLEKLGALFGKWRDGGFGAVYADVCAVDFLRGQVLSVRQTDGDAEPVCGVCGGIQPDGSLLVGATRVYAGEAHVESRHAPSGL